MTLTTDEAQKALAAIRDPFPPDKIGKLPRSVCRDCSSGRCGKHRKEKCKDCGAWITTAHIHLDYVGHAELTDRLLELDPFWSWEPVAFDDVGQPLIHARGDGLEMWIRLTFAGVTRLGVGTCLRGKNEPQKELIGDAIRNAAMRFGAALDLWAKSDLHSQKEDAAPEPEPVAPALVDAATVAEILEYYNICSDDDKADLAGRASAKLGVDFDQAGLSTLTADKAAQVLAKARVAATSPDVGEDAA